MKTLFLVCLTFWTFAAQAQVQTYYVQPVQTDMQYAVAQDSHLVARNTGTRLHKLFLYIGGTGSNTRQYLTLSNFAANLGYDVINLSYPNGVAPAVLASQTDSLAFDKYRQEICYGTPLSAEVTVDTLNAVYTRVVKLLNYLHATYPSQQWDQYLSDPATLNWANIAVGGHSQGAGHAAYFAKLHPVERVLMFAGPNDYSTHFSNSAPWMRMPGATPASRHYAYESLLDEFIDFGNQLICLQGLGIYPLYDTVYADQAVAPYQNSRILYTTQSPGIVVLNHNVPVKQSTINNAVWTYMLTASTSSSVHSTDAVVALRVFPNPATSVLYIRSGQALHNRAYSLLSLSGQVLLSGTISTENECSIALSDIPKGLYLLYIEGAIVQKIIKH